MLHFIWSLYTGLIFTHGFRAWCPISHLNIYFIRIWLFYCVLMMLCEVSLLSATPGDPPLSRLFPARYPTIVVSFLHAFISIKRHLGKLKAYPSRRATVYCISSSFFSSTYSFVLSNSMQLYLPLMRGSCHLRSTSTVLHTYVTHRNTKFTICPLISIFCFLQSLTGSN